MLRSFSHPVACRCMLLRVIRSCCAKFETGQTFRYAQAEATTPNIESPVIIPNLLIACGAKKGRGTKAQKGKGRGGACYKSRCFCILSTNILTNPDQGNVSCQYVTNHKKGELLNLHHGCFFLIHENKLLIAAQPITLVSASQTEFTTLEAL